MSEKGISGSAPSLGLMLCPNRNLTTLTASILALHPQIQVMNHGFERLKAAGALRFIESGSDDDLDVFFDIATEMSTGGRRGDYGGSIVSSHAFDRQQMRAAYESRYGTERLKPYLRALVWKEGARLREHLMANNIDPIGLARKLPRLRFISPLRHPIAHAIGLAKYYSRIPSYVKPSLPDLEPRTIAHYVLSAHADFLRWRRELPEQFFAFTQRDLGSELAVRLSAFLDVGVDYTWLEAATVLFTDDSPTPTQSTSLLEAFSAVLKSHFADNSELVSWYLENVQGESVS